jgi:hypothetical protein
MEDYHITTLGGAKIIGKQVNQYEIIRMKIGLHTWPIHSERLD